MTGELDQEQTLRDDLEANFEIEAPAKEEAVSEAQE